ncbi:nucleotide sugar dehydrogenase [Acuticoccus sp. MNP-M23]|uniref:nucleotide sugar dehydrogenase n=1 Tax=Acuticoccus sp. MNP-M23 TaxID=3072793 RepID=UPI0028150106|nr:nucleotide sugar dehydrogenase [Acuticoccus sp. MNP-M23]WMS41544.1 nucleotide sugar dehydrogenase [Acuticoccus sp. MNP-M23]
MDLASATIAVIGLGYVGLPVAAAFGQHRTTIGFDHNKARIDALNGGHDATGEVSADELGAATHLTLTADAADLAAASVFIIAVPTPVDGAKRPDLGALKAASRAVGAAMREGAVVIYESTVFPGCTRDVCAPILAAASGLTLDETFFLGYSPERANPGDRTHRLSTITKVTAGSTPEAAEAIDALYREIVPAGTHLAPSLEVAEAAKVIENTQRDVNIALMNELAIVFHKLGLDTGEVLAAAGTKWNFLPFRPGLVGGHCIGVDPYYLTHRAQEVGHHPEVILAGRRINDGMGAHIVDRVARLMMRKRLPVVGSKILVMGLAFKENCPDIRNSRVTDIVAELTALHADVDVWDPWVDPAEAEREYGLTVRQDAPPPGYDAMILAVAHTAFSEIGASGIRALGAPGAVFFDVKSLFEKGQSDGRL